ncbi:hypothetical protein, partial [Plasmodium yoelii yoelii]
MENIQYSSYAKKKNNKKGELKKLME